MTSGFHATFILRTVELVPDVIEAPELVHHSDSVREVLLAEIYDSAIREQRGPLLGRIERIAGPVVGNKQDLSLYERSRPDIYTVM